MATQRRNALGRGLDALLSMEEVKTEGSSSINEIELSKISVNPNQPRREFDETALEELADSIREIGIIQPITLRKVSDDEYQIIAGERRYRASQKAGLDTIPAYIRTADDENVMEMALIGCAYELSWNGKMYKDYAQAYMDIMDNNPNTNSFQDLLPPNHNYTDTQLKDLLRKRKDTYRRYRDLSIFAVIGVYLISIIDAYVDAELSNFDISPDLSMRVEPTIINNNPLQPGSKSVGVQCSLRF